MNDSGIASPAVHENVLPDAPDALMNIFVNDYLVVAFGFASAMTESFVMTDALELFHFFTLLYLI